MEWELSLNPVVLAAVALAALAWWSSRRSARAAVDTAGTARMKARADYALGLLNTDPLVQLRINSVSYRLTHPDGREIKGGHPFAELDRYQAQAEVVVEGQLSGSPQELHIGFYEVPRAGRPQTHPRPGDAPNQTMFFTVGDEEGRHTAVLPAGEQVGFTWTDRRPVEEWMDVFLNLPSPPKSRLLPRPFSWSGLRGSLGARLRSLLADVPPRVSGFQIIAQPRQAEAINAVWTAELVEPPVSVQEWASDGHLLECTPEPRTPIDDEVLHYRLEHLPADALNFR